MSISSRRNSVLKSSLSIKSIADTVVKFKESLSDLIINDISPITKEMKHLMNNKDEIIKILIDGSNKAQEIANEVLIDIKKIIGVNF